MRLVGESHVLTHKAQGRKTERRGGKGERAKGRKAKGGEERAQGRKGNAPEGGHILQGRGSPLSNGRNTNHAPVARPMVERQGQMIERETSKDRGEPLSYIICPLQGHEERL